MEERRERDNSGIHNDIILVLSAGHVSNRFTVHYQLTTNK